MKYFLVMLFAFFCNKVVAENIYYTLNTKKICSIDFNLEKADCWEADKWSETRGIFLEGNSWCLKDEISGTCPEGRLIDKENGIVILQEKKEFTGSSMLYLIEKNKTFIWTEVLFDPEKASEISVRKGTYK